MECQSSSGAQHRSGSGADVEGVSRFQPRHRRTALAAVRRHRYGCIYSFGRLRLSLVRTSASLPRKPMRVTLFWYMVVISVSLNFPYPARVTLREASEWARLPSAKECFIGGAR